MRKVIKFSNDGFKIIKQETQIDNHKTMKLNFSLLLFILIATSSNAQDKRYIDNMSKNISIIDTAMSAANLQLVANNFERIALAEKNKWLPYYYTSYTLTRQSYVMSDKSQIDNVLDKADKYIAVADSLQPENSEIITVKAFIASARILVNPMVRGAQFGPISGQLLDQAIKLDPNNPRPYFLKGTSAFYTPPAFGGGKDKAEKFFEMALMKYSTFKPADELAPNWGEARTKYMLDQCKE